MTVEYTPLAAGGMLTLAGELDHHAAVAAIRRSEQLLDEYQPGALVLDLKALSFMDSSGIALLLKLKKRMQHISGTFEVQNTPPQAYRVLVGAGIDRLIPISKRRKEA
jgi:anti-anti-sigma factor